MGKKLIKVKPTFGDREVCSWKVSNRKNATEEKLECKLPTERIAIQRKGKANKQKKTLHIFFFHKMEEK